MVNLLDYAKTQRQREVIQAAKDHNTQAAAAASLGISVRVFRRILQRVKLYAARAGVAPDQGVDKPTPPGYVIRGTSTLYDEEGKARLQWVKTREDWAEQLAALEEALTDLFDDVPAHAPVTERPPHPSADLLAMYPEGDPHWGMRVWGPETGGTSYDLNIAKREYYAAVDYLVDHAPETGTAISLNVGDNFHSDNPENKTRRSGHDLNVDGRIAKVFQTVLEARCYKIDRMLSKHDTVVVRELPGNHDPVLSIGFVKALAAYYRNEPRVRVIDSPSVWWHYQHGAVMFGTTHGDGAKVKDMPLLMATDEPAMWGATRFRHCYTGHMHHLERWELPGCVVEMLRTLAARNEYEHHAGFRSGRDMLLRVYHKEYGEVHSHRLGVEYIRAMLGDAGLEV